MKTRTKVIYEITGGIQHVFYLNYSMKTTIYKKETVKRLLFFFSKIEPDMYSSIMRSI